MAKRTRDYRSDYLYKMLRKPQEASNYLNAAMHDAQKTGDYEVFLLALLDVAKACGVSKVASTTGRSRTSLYKALSKQGDPKLSTVVDILQSMHIGMDFQVMSKGKAA